MTWAAATAFEMGKLVVSATRTVNGEGMLDGRGELDG